MRRIVPLAGCAITAAIAATTLTAVPSYADQTYYVPISNTWTVLGRGNGHGHGMSQYGAEGAAIQGLSASDILDFYYPHTKVSQAKGNIRVLITSDWTSDVIVRPASGLTVTDLTDAATWTLPTKKSILAWRMTPIKHGKNAVQYEDRRGWHRWRVPGQRILDGDAQFDAKGPLTLLVPSGDSLVGRQYRGALRISSPYLGATVRDTVNVLKLDAYVQGVVPNEMPASWNQQAVRAQAVAARTYAAYERALNRKRYYQICDTTSCQVYNGRGSEQRSSNVAVQATKGEILRYDGKPAFSQFSSSSGGWTADGGEPYLPAQKDPYDGFDGNPVHSWTLTVSASSLEASHPQIGTLVDLRVTKRDGNGAWHGRVEQIVLDGTDGTAYMTGDDFRWQYGLDSDWFTIEPTAIITRWRELGGPDSELGMPTSGEYAVGKGAAQNFQHGKIFWTSSTGAYDVKGPILRAYKSMGGPQSPVGWPVTGMLEVASGGHRERFQHGKLYSTVQTGAHWVYGAVLKKWSSEGAAGGWIGYPTADTTTAHRTITGVFQHATISWNRETKTFTVTKTG